MESIKELYNGNFDTSLKDGVSINYNPKQKYDPLPEGAKVTSVNKRISVDEIENGYVVTEDVETNYEMRNDEGEVDNRYHWHCKKYFSEQKPFEVKLMY